MSGKFEIFLGQNKEYYFRLKSGNGEIILASESYINKSGCENGIASVKTHAPDDKYYERKESKNNKPYFNLKASNGQIIGTSEMYESESARENGIESVKSNAPSASVVERPN